MINKTHNSISDSEHINYLTNLKNVVLKSIKRKPRKNDINKLKEIENQIKNYGK